MYQTDDIAFKHMIVKLCQAIITVLPVIAVPYGAAKTDSNHKTVITVIN